MARRGRFEVLRSEFLDVLLRVTEDDDVGVIGDGDDVSMRTAPLGVVSGAVVISVTGSSTR